MKIRVSLYTILFASLLGSCDNFLDIPSETSLSSEVIINHKVILNRE